MVWYITPHRILRVFEKNKTDTEKNQFPECILVALINDLSAS